ncbi:ABC transporter substrate-binding protein [Cellulosilyticum sp. I15G10I2]|uniref:ABC transporter substrate-binding protein n=1 Tax=Cellulosilyticum sp. I15G10I2 TaxID=1892843 RepID=UPI00085C461C|nr:extracellular solute-binding protein [Cellulosilyticum sp. I15G10I2]
MKKNEKKYKRMIGFLVIIGLLIMVGLWVQAHTEKSMVLNVALYSGNSWGVPQKHTYKIYDEAAELFEEAYKDLDVRIHYKTGMLIQHYSEWFAGQVLRGVEPDVFLVLEEDFSTYASIGLFEDLSPYIQKDAEFKEEYFYAKALQAGQYEGSQYTLPFQIAPSFMVVNKTLLEKENITINPDNWTWEHFYNICKRVTKDLDKDGVLDQFGVYGYEWEHAFYTNDHYLFTNNGSKMAFDDERLYESIEFMKKMYGLNRGTIIKESYFDKGQVAFKTFTLPEYRAYGTYPYRILKYESFKWEAIPFPKGPYGESSSKLYTVQIGMSSRSDSKKLAYEFIKFITQNEAVQQKVWDDTYALSTNKELVEEIYASDHPEILQNKVVNGVFLNDIIGKSYIIPRFKLYRQLKSVMDQKIFQIIAQDSDTRIGIKELKEDIQHALDESQRDF